MRQEDEDFLKKGEEEGLFLFCDVIYIIIIIIM